MSGPMPSVVSISGTGLDAAVYVSVGAHRYIRSDVADQLLRALLSVDASDEILGRDWETVNAALTAAGLPDQSSRDQARKEMGK